MNVNNSDEQLLLQKARQFDEAALSEIYDSYNLPLYRYAMRLLGDQQSAEDCISETFLRFLKMLRNGSGPTDHLQSYLYRIAHNWITDFYRRNKNDNLEIDENIPDQGHSPDEQIQHKLQSVRIRKELLSLTSDQQQVIILKYLEGMENEEIARLLNKKNGAIRVITHRAISALRRRLKRLEKLNVF
jgi:RNA polymerase sigma-70 factor (ECF subfamily)